MRRPSGGAWLLTVAGLASMGLGACTGSDVFSLTAQPSTVFVLEVGTDTPVFVLATDPLGDVGWLSVFRGGERIWLQPRCDVPDCGMQPVVCNAGFPVAQALTSGPNAGMSKVSFAWDGSTSVVDGPDGCETRVPAPEGTYTARFCYAHQAVMTQGDPFQGGGDRLVDPVCVDRTFELGQDLSVVVLVGDDAG